MKKFLRKWLPKIGLTLKSDQDYAYKQRDIAAMLAASFAIQANYDVSYYMDDQEDWDNDWRMVLQISKLGYPLTDEGQVSWHLGPESNKIAKECFAEVKLNEWDGTDLSKSYDVVKMVAL